MRLLAFLVLSFGTVYITAAPFPFRIWHLSKVTPGEIVKVYLYNPAQTPLSGAVIASIPRKGMHAITARAFPVKAFSKTFYVMLLGTSSDLRPGKYRTSLFLKQKGVQTPIASFPLHVAHKRYPVIKFHMSSEMRGAIAPSARTKRAHEAITYWNIIGSENMANEFSPFQAPSIPVRHYKYRTSPYGQIRYFIYRSGKKSGRSYHRGIDFAATTGTPIYSATSGKVRFSGYRILTGKTIVIETLPGLFFCYYHMSAREVSRGQIVKQGTFIGRIGDTGFVTGPHLHWEVRVGRGEAPDPDLLVGRPLVSTAVLSSLMRG